MSNWQEFKLKDVCADITVGYVGPMAEEYQEAGIPFLRSLNIKPFKLDYDNLKFIDDKFHEKLRKSALRPGDIVVVRTGYPGTACVIPKALKVANCSDLVVIRPGEKINPHFLAAIFNSTFGQNLVSGNLVGAAQQHFNVTVAKELKLQLPSRILQDKIAAILSAYDDLIENNQRRIALLERMAEEIYREWFVRMRFPGHTQVKFEKGVPEGWEVKPSIEIFDVLSGGTPKTDVAIFWDGGIPFFTPKDASEHFYTLDTEKKITAKGLESCNSRLYRKNTIFITARGTVGKMALAYRDMAMNQSCYALLPQSRDKIFFYYLAMRNAISYIKGISKSGVFDNIIVDTFKVIPLLMPESRLIAIFNDKVEPIFRQVGCLLEANEHLVELRNKLLSRLISGTLSVENLDIQFPPRMLNDAATGAEAE